jgi:hypothetical protein
MVQQPPRISDASQASQASVPPFSGSSYQENLWPKPPDAGPPHQFMSGRRLRAQFGLTTPYSDSKRISYGLLWAAWTVVLTIAGFGLLFSGSVFSGLLSFVLAFFAGRYDYRIWSWQAKRLLFFIVW